MKIKFNKKKILALTLASSLFLCSSVSLVGKVYAQGHDNNTNKSATKVLENDQLDQLNFTHGVHLFKFSGEVMADLNMYLRKGPGIENEDLDLICGGRILTAYGISENGWYLVEYNGVLGFASNKYLTNLTLSDEEMLLVKEYQENIEQDEDEVLEDVENSNEIIDEVDPYENIQMFEGTLYANANVNFRETANIKGKKISLIKKGSELKLLGFENGWYLVEYNGKIGYVLSNYVSYNKDSQYRDDFLDVVYIKYETPLLHDLNDPYTAKYYFNKYEVCEVLGMNEEWYLVRYEELFGYVKRESTSKIANTAVVVNIDEQKLTLYKDNKIVVETDVVTGTQGIFDTPIGLYSIRNKVIDTSLISEEYGYNQPVEYWMPFNGGIGLHDASWRHSFGGEIYIKNGSHGCVNIPPKYADDVFDNVTLGTKVLVHR